MYLARPSASTLPKCSLLASGYYALLLPIPSRPAAHEQHPHRLKQQARSRFYASHAAHHWPTKPHSQLTPYEIFNQPHSSGYHKPTFYQLVKLYHPDCLPPEDHPCALLPKSTRTERFRLIVAANTLLSDPTKKKAYDAFGVGWNAIPRHTDIRKRTAATYASGPWKTSPAGNATWEDWERWYKSEGMGSHNFYSAPGGGTASTDEATKPLTTNTNFVTIILLLSFTGILIQLARVDQFAASFEEKRDRKHRNIQRDLWRLRKDDMGKDGRVQAFLRMRDPEGYGVAAEDVREERMRRLLPEGEVCLSEGVRARDVE